MNGVLANIAHNQNRLQNIQRDRLMRRQRIFRCRINPMEKYSDRELFCRFRFHRPVIYILVDILQPYLQHRTGHSMAIPVLLQVLIALRFLATGTLYLVASDTVNVSNATVCRCIRRVCVALCRIKNNYIKFPMTDEDRSLHKTKLYRVAGIPNCIGCVDGTLIRIVKPPLRAHEFICRRGWPAINAMGICSTDSLFTFISVKWPGNVHDSRVFSSSQACEAMERSTNCVLLGDSAYASKSYMLTPYRNPTTDPQKVYNRKQSRTRVLIEIAYGILKTRFRCLMIALRNNSPERAAAVITACFVLHNFGILQKDFYTMTDEDRRDWAEHLELTNTNDLFREDQNSVTAVRDNYAQLLYNVAYGNQN